MKALATCMFAGRPLCGRQGGACSLLSGPLRRARPAARRSPAAALSATAERDAVKSSAVQKLDTVQENLDTVQVTFKVLLRVNFGECLRVVGNVEALGGWEVDRAPQMSWTEGHIWTATLALPAGQALEYKFVHCLPNRAPVWESTQNRTFTPSPNAALVATQWNNPMAQFEAKAIPMQAEVLELLEGPYFTTAAPAAPAEAPAATDPLGADPASPAQPSAALAAAAARFEPGANYDADIESMSSVDLDSSLEDVVAALTPGQPLTLEAQAAPATTTASPAANAAAAAPAAAREATGVPAGEAAESGPAQVANLSSVAGSSLLKTVGKTAGFVAMGVAAGALMSALAVDVVDVAMMGAVMAAAGSAAMSSPKGGEATSDEEGEVGEGAEGRSRRRPKGSEPGVIMAAAVLSAMDVGKSVLLSASETLEAASAAADQGQKEGEGEQKAP